MAHLTSRSAYEDLARRLNRYPQGAAPAKLLFRILALLFSEEEAELVARLPVRPFTPSRAAGVWGIEESRTRGVLDRLAGRGLLVDLEIRGQRHYVLPPPMAGFFEFALMRVRDDLDQKLLAELFEQYITVEDDFIKGLIVGGRTQQGRFLVQEPAIPAKTGIHVLDYERASRIIASATDVGVGLCYCRHKRKHLGRACEAPLDVCLTLNDVAASLIRYGTVRRISHAEGLKILQRSQERNLVQFGENVQEGVNFICNCCPCCCEALAAHRRFGHLHAVHTSGFLPEVADHCSGCGRCLPVCPAGVMALGTEFDDGHGRKRVAIDRERCLGCGLCVRHCPREALTLTRGGTRVITPVNAVHKTVLMAVERGTLQHLIFDNQVLFSHRALAAVLGAILNLPPVKKTLASNQIGSRYLAALSSRLAG